MSDGSSVMKGGLKSKMSSSRGKMAHVAIRVVNRKE